MSGKTFHLFRSPRNDKKYCVIAPGGIRIDFGQKGYKDFTKHKNEERKQRYINRHILNENHSPSGMYTAGWWSRWLLWNKPTLTESIRDIERNFSIKIIFHRNSF